VAKAVSHQPFTAEAQVRFEESPYRLLPISAVERSKARVYGQSLARVAGSNSAGGIDHYGVCRK
jgi:hypothetical protein